MCKVDKSSGDSLAIAMETDGVVVVATLDLRFGALEGSHHSRYPIGS